MRERDLQVLDDLIAARGGFSHREHLELAWEYLQRYPFDEAAQVMTAAIQHLARAHGAEGRYHETLTRAWLHFVAVHRQRWGAADFAAFIARNPELLARQLALEFYSRERLFGIDARNSWVESDLRPLPALAG